MFYFLTNHWTVFWPAIPFYIPSSNVWGFQTFHTLAKYLFSIFTYYYNILVCIFRLKLKKVGKTTKPFRYDLSQTPYDYTVEVRNRFKGLELIDRVPDELWTEAHDMVQETGNKTIPKEKKWKKAKWLSEEALQIAVKRREAKSKGEKERHKHLSAEFQRTARRDKKAFLSNQCKEREEKNRMGKTRDLLDKDRNGRDLTEAEDIKKRWQEYTKNCAKKIFSTQIIMVAWSLT